MQKILLGKLHIDLLICFDFSTAKKLQRTMSCPIAC